jgi:hypothetical protein
MVVQDYAQMSPDATSSGKHPSNMHTIFLADCTLYFQWMSMGTSTTWVHVWRALSDTDTLQLL